MATLGTRKFYKAFNDSATESDQQIIKNKGYVTIMLNSAFYNSRGNFWQRIFGGTDNIALSSTITYQGGGTRHECKMIVDKRVVRTNNNHPLALSRQIALKVPANADGLELKIEFTAVRNDNFDHALSLLNSEEFQKPLELAPLPLGQILSITSVVKKLFAGVPDNSILESTFAGVISRDRINNPIAKDRLTAGYLILIANNSEDDAFLDKVDPAKFSVETDGLRYEGKLVEHTNLVFSVTFDALKDIDEQSNWNRKYRDALRKLDEIESLEPGTDGTKILRESIAIWNQAGALLFDDPGYIDSEKDGIHSTYITQIREKYARLTGNANGKIVEVVTQNTLNIKGGASISVVELERISHDYLHALQLQRKGEYWQGLLEKED